MPARLASFERTLEAQLTLLDPASRVEAAEAALRGETGDSDDDDEASRNPHTGSNGLSGLVIIHEARFPARFLHSCLVSHQAPSLGHILQTKLPM